MQKSPLLTTKLFVPPQRPTMVLRTRLIEKLNDGLVLKLILVSAPAGFGKTTMLSYWVHKVDKSAGWFSIDKDDNDPVHFISYIISAFQNFNPGIGKSVKNMLGSPHPPPFESILINLINDLAGISRDYTLVIDDYHLITSPRIHTIMTFLLDHLPQNIHLIISTRSDPPLPIARLRAQNQILEMRAEDLCFNIDEIYQFLNEKLNLGLSFEDISLIELRTEGWIAGLQLAALSIQGREEKSSFIKAFSGDNRYIVDYLMEEVINRQPLKIQKFLIDTSILDRLCGPLCDAMLGVKNSQEILVQLEHGDLFIFPLDIERHWFRYHPLFANILQQKLNHEKPGIANQLNRRAGEWYARNGLGESAVDHLLIAKDFEGAAELIKTIAEVDWDRGQESKLLRWLTSLPEDKISSNPQLCIFHARELFENGQPELAEKSLQMAETLLISDNFHKSDVSELDPQHKFLVSKKELSGRIAVIRGSMAAQYGDIPRIIQYCREALNYLDERNLMWRSVAATTLGFAHGWSGDGDLQKAHQAFCEAREISDSASNIYMNLLSSMCLYTIELLQGRLEQAEEKFNNLLKLAKENGMGQLGISGSICGSLGINLFLQGHIKEGMSYIEQGIKIAESGKDALALAGCKLNLLQALFIAGDYEGARKTLGHIEKIASEFNIPPWMTHTLSAWRGRILLAKDQLESVSNWVLESGLDIKGQLTNRNEFEHLVFARYLYMIGKSEEALSLLKRMQKNAESATRMMTVTQILILKALILYGNNEMNQSVDALRQALSLSEGTGFIGIFQSEGKYLSEILEYVMKNEDQKIKIDHHSLSESYLKKLQLALRAKPQLKSDALVEQLSDREIDVLNLIALGLTNQQIAEHLFISLNTVKTHLKNINLKLNSHNRTQAMAKAKELGILS